MKNKIKINLVATSPRVGKYVHIGCGLSDSDKVSSFVAENENKDFLILEVGNHSSKLEGVPFRVKHCNIYKAVECKISQREKLHSNFEFFSPVRCASLKLNEEMFSLLSKSNYDLGVDEVYFNDHILKYIVYTCTDYIDGDNGICNNDFDEATKKVAIFLNDVVTKAKNDYDEIIIERM